MSVFEEKLPLPSWTTRPFRGAFLISVVVHVVLVLLWTGAAPSGTPGGGVLQVTLLMGDAPVSGATGGEATAEAAAQVPSESARPEAAQESLPTEDRKPDPTPLSDQTVQSLALRDRRGPSASNDAATRRAGEHQSKKDPAMEPVVSEVVKSALAPPGKVVRLQEVSKHNIFESAVVATRADVLDTEPDKESEVPGASEVAGKRGGTRGTGAERILAELQDALLPRLDYPMLARRRGWEGRVRVGLLVEPDGDLTGLHIVESSGFKVLDRAAIKDLKEVGTLPSAGPWLGEQEMPVVLPVQYRLTQQ